MSTTTNTLIQTASTKDWSVVADVTLAANQQYAAKADPNFWSNYEVSIRELILNDQDIIRIVAKEDENIVASVIYCPPDSGNMRVKNPYPEMRLLSVLPEHRNKGLAAILIKECEKRATRDGAKAMTLHTTALMTTAKAMYERRGYTRYPQIDFEPAAGFVVWGYIKELQGAD